MPRLVFLCEFDGSNFSGSQKQANGRTVQAELEKALSIFFKQNIKIVLASRVDSGVHAKGMIGHFDLKYNLPNLSEHAFCRHLNGILPLDIAILRLKEINSDFHSRKHAIKRSYVYKIRSFTQRQPLDGSQIAHTSVKLNCFNLNKLSQILLGKHDFSGLSKVNKSKSWPICEVFEAYWQEQKNNLFIFRISADHFLYNMVRIIIGTQIDIQNAKLEVNSLEKALKLKNKTWAGSTAPSQGLCLENIEYPYTLF